LHFFAGIFLYPEKKYISIKICVFCAEIYITFSLFPNL